MYNYIKLIGIFIMMEVTMDFGLMKDFMDRLTAWRIPGNNISVCVDNKEVFTYQILDKLINS